MTQEQRGVLISDGRSSVRLTRDREPDEFGYPTIIEVTAGPFRGAVLDRTVEYTEFRKQLSALHESLKGEAWLGSHEGNELVLSGNGLGGIEIRAKIIGEHVPLIQLTFTFNLDQSYLPVIIRQLEAEFPPPCSSKP
jgi:hypothetical protein